MRSRLRIVTYATHEQGMFRKLVHNPFRASVRVLGMGLPWKGFFDKLKAVREYAIRLNPEDVLIFLDGFDTQIMADPRDALAIWKKIFGARVLVSKTPRLFGLSVLDSYVERRIFRGDINSGMYMGKAADISYMLAKAMEKEKDSKGDDQCALNLAAAELGGLVRVDRDELIFKNLTYRERKNLQPGTNPFQAIFYSFPGTVSTARFSRVFKEYAPMIWPEILALIVVTLAAICLLRRACRCAPSPPHLQVRQTPTQCRST